MKTPSLLSFLLLLVSAATAFAQQPNILLIMADDVDAEAFQAYAGNPVNTTGSNGGIATPNLETLAQQGLRFTNAFTVPICTPTRTMLLTGQHNYRNYRAFAYLDNNQTTFAQVLRANGYATAIAGKWQLAEPDGDTPITPSGAIAPNITPAVLRDDYGFDSYLLWQMNQTPPNQGSRYWNPKLETASGDGLSSVLVPTGSGDYGPDLFAQHLKDFITDAAGAAQPFLAYYAMALPHDPWVSTPDAPGATTGDDEQYFDENVEYIDTLVGELLAHLDDPDGNPGTDDGIRENTIVIFTSDNGTSPRITVNTTERGNVQGDKGTASYDGTHVPLIIDWGSKTPPSLESRMTDLSDIFPTLLEVTGIAAPAGLLLDGAPIIDATGAVQANKDSIYLWYDPLGRPFPPAEFAQNTQYKLYADGRFYDIVNDKQETTNLNDYSLTAPEQTNFTALDTVLDSKAAGVADRALAPRFATVHWAVPPAAGATPGSVTMTAGIAEDASNPVEYQFRNVTTNSTGSWQTDRTYESFASGTNQYQYRTRDLFGNTSAWSDIAEVTLAAASQLAPDSPSVVGNLRLWLRDATLDYAAGVWSDSSGLGNDLGDVTGLAGGYGGSFGTDVLNPVSGPFAGKVIDAVRLDDNDLMGASGINGGIGFSDLTILAVYKVSATGSGTRPLGLGSKTVEGTTDNYDRFNLATDPSVRYDDGSNIGGLSHPTSLVLRATRLSAGHTVSDWIDSGGGLTLNLDEAIVGSGGSKGTAAPNFVTQNDDFYIGELSANIGVDDLSTATSHLVQIAVYNGALSVAQIEAIAAWMEAIPEGNPTPAQSWRLEWFGQVENSGDAADGFDFDQDGQVNLLERAFGTIPTDGSSTDAPTQSIVEAGGSDHLAITYRQIMGGSGTIGDGYTAEGMTYTVEYDNDLDDPWSTGNITVVSVQDNTPTAGIQTVTIRLNTPITAADQQFMRLKVTAAG